MRVPVVVSRHVYKIVLSLNITFQTFTYILPKYHTIHAGSVSLKKLVDTVQHIANNVLALNEC